MYLLNLTHSINTIIILSRNTHKFVFGSYNKYERRGSYGIGRELSNDGQENNKYFTTSTNYNTTKIFIKGINIVHAIITFIIRFNLFEVIMILSIPFKYNTRIFSRI